MTHSRFLSSRTVAPFRLLPLAVAPILAGLALAAQAAPSDNARGAVPAGMSAYATNRLLIQPRAGLSADNLAKILKVHQGRARRLGKSDLHLVDLPNGAALAVAKILERHPQLKLVELDRLVLSTGLPNDPYLGSEWHLNKVGAPTAWDSAGGMGDGVKIAILDSGVDGGHPDLAGNLIPGYNFMDWNYDTSDSCGHGTAVAGTAAAVSNNSSGVAGVAGKAKIMPVKIASYNSTYGGCYAYYSTVASGINFAADNGARVINVSYVGIAASQAVLNAAQYAKSKGSLVFASAGNNGRDEGLTPSTAFVMVSATDENDNLASWSSYGSFVTISAPGTNIWTTNNGSGYGQWNGTSFASPLTAGVAALMMSANPSADNLTIESLLYATAIDRGAAGRDPYFGYGRVNAAAAVQAVVARTIKADTQAPSAAVTAPLAGGTVSGLVAVDVAASDNVGVVRADLKVNGTVVATDTSAPFGFSWDSAGVANGTATLSIVAYDAAGNAGTSASLTVNVANGVTPVAPNWTRCASEGNACNFSGTRQVRYGANNSYAFTTATGSVACSNAVFGDPMWGVVKTCDYGDAISSTPAPAPAPAPVIETWTDCAGEGANCTFTGTRTVRYGANGIYAKAVFNGATACTNGVFGDPLYGTVKACSYSSITQ
jgi:subtilisin family serine protease